MSEFAVMALRFGVLAYAAGAVRGFSGFGAAMVFMPLASAMTSPAVAAPILLLTDTATNWMLWRKAARICSWTEIRVLLVGALIGFPIGIEILTRGDPIRVRWMACVLLLASLVVIASGWRFQPREDQQAKTGFGVGLLSGLMSGIAQLGNPPVVAYWLGSHMPPERMRANLTVYFAILTALGLALFAMKGLLDQKILVLAAICIPGYALGLLTGNMLFPLASSKLYRSFAMVLILASTVAGMPALDPLLRVR